MNNEEKFKLLYEDMMKVAIRTTTIYKNFNPSHGPVNKGCWKCPHSPQGECRMLTCLCCEGDEVEGESAEEWFIESCDQCDDPIFDKYQALRIPCEEGGWKGCFCSIQCIEEVYLDGDEDKNPIREALVIAMENNLTDSPVDINYSVSDDI